MSDILAVEGVPVDLRGGRALYLDRRGVWFVHSGRVDVFAVRTERGRIAGRRTHLFRVGPGQALFGADASGDAALTLVAVGTADVELLAVDPSVLGAWAQEPEQREALAAAIDAWIETLCGAVSRARPARWIDLGPGAEVELAAEAVASPVGHALWVTHQRGSSRIMGHAAATAEGGELVPIPATGWIEAAEPALIVAEVTLDVLASGEVWNGLRRLQYMVLDCVVDQVVRADQAEAERLQIKTASGRDTMLGALGRLASTIGGMPRPRAASAAMRLRGPIGGGVENALLAAARLVGAAAGIAIQRPAPTSHDPATRDPLAGIARASRVRTRGVALRDAWWRDDVGPLLAYRGEAKRPVALLPSPRFGYVLHDPAVRERLPVTEAVAGELAPFAHTLYRPFADMPLGMWDVLRFGVHGSGRDFAWVAALGAAVGLLGMVTPLATGALFDNIIPSADRGQLLQLTIVLLVCAVSGALFQVARSIALLRVEARMGASVQAAVWDRLLSLPMPFFRPYAAGDLAVRAMGIDEIRRTLSGAALTAILGGIFSVFNFGLLFYYDTRLAWWATLLIGVAVMVTVGTSYLQLRHQRTSTRLRGKVAGVVLQLLSGVAKLKTSGAEVQAFDLWARLFSAQRERQVQVRVIGNFYAAFAAVFPVVAIATVFATAAQRAPGAAIGTGSFLAFVAAFTGCLTAAMATGTAIIGALGAVPLYEQARPILDARPEVDRGKGDPGELSGALELQHVSFRYSADGPPILRDVSISVRPGEFVAFVGPSGSGKSTIMRLLLGFEALEAGTVSYDDQELAGLDVQAVRRQIGVVLQAGRLMSGDLFTNIVGSSTATLADAWEAARMAGLEEDIKAMPMQMHTVVSEGGGGLSGGQRQRLMIARAVVNRPRILLFDEATSALDNRTQAIVSQSLERLQATRIVIAHRLSTIINADRIVVVKAGQIAESGTYQDLMRAGGVFAELAARQLA